MRPKKRLREARDARILWPLRIIRELMATGKMEPIIARGFCASSRGSKKNRKKVEKEKKKRKSKEPSAPKRAAAKEHEAQKKAKQERPEGAAGASNRGDARSRTSRSKAVMDSAVAAKSTPTPRGRASRPAARKGVGGRQASKSKPRHAKKADR